MSKLLTKEQDLFLRSIAKGKGNKEVANLLNKKFRLCLSLQQIKTYKKNHKISSGLTGRFEKGNVPYNKGKKLDKGPNRTSFKKGNVPYNHKPVGSERVDVNGYVKVKVKNPRTWRHKHVVIWEKNNGEAPKNHAIVFLDGNKLNLSLDNLALVSKAELARLNQNNLLSNNSDLSKTGILIAKLQTKAGQLRKKD